MLGGQAVELLPRNSAAEGGSIASTTDHSHRHAKQDATRLRTDSTASSSKSKQPAVQATRALGDVVIGRPSAAVKVSEVAAKKVGRVSCGLVQFTLSVVWERMG